MSADAATHIPEIPRQSSLSQQLLPILFFISAVAALVWSMSQMRAASRQMSESQEHRDECRYMDREISRLGSHPTIASLEIESPQAVIERVSQAMLQANIPPSSLISISPSEASRIAATNYQQRQTQLVLRGISLPLVASFFNALQSSVGLYLRDIDLTVASDDRNASNGVENWDVRLTLTQLIYSPTSR